MKKKRKSLGQLSKEVSQDTVRYDAKEVGHALSDDIVKHLNESIEKHYHIIDEDEFCVVMVIASDCLVQNLKRRKFYCWPYLPSPRPNQAVFLYNKKLDKITKRLWVLPSAQVMAELSSICHVAKPYKTMQAWSIAFFEGKFWEYIRYEHGITMPSEHEYFESHREELIKAGCKPIGPNFSDPFDFSKVSFKEGIDTVESVA